MVPWFLSAGYAGEDLQADWCGNEDLGAWTGNGLGRGSQWGLSTLDFSDLKSPGLANLKMAEILGSLGWFFCGIYFAQIHQFFFCLRHFKIVFWHPFGPLSAMKWHLFFIIFTHLSSDCRPIRWQFFRVTILTNQHDIPHGGWSISPHFAFGQNPLFSWQNLFILHVRVYPHNYFGNIFNFLSSQFLISYCMFLEKHPIFRVSTIPRVSWISSGKQ